MASRSLNDLLPVVREKAHRFTSECEKQGIELLVYCTYRSSTGTLKPLQRMKKYRMPKFTPSGIRVLLTW
jgi:hypothetical protein